ncbi:hypothetical protein cypCar_00038675, partial [Cyprinus carpio]
MDAAVMYTKNNMGTILVDAINRHKLVHRLSVFHSGVLDELECAKEGTLSIFGRPLCIFPRKKTACYFMPGLVSCLGDLIVTGILILFSDHVQSEIWTNEGIAQLSCLLLSVSDVQYGGLGSRVTLTCGGAHGGVNKAREVDPCKQEDIGVNECMITNPPFWTSKVLVNITEINPLGSNSTIIQIDVHELLKPDPPEDVRVLQVEGQPTQLLVQWSCPSSWPAKILPAFPLTFSLRYRPIGSSYWST